MPPSSSNHRTRHAIIILGSFGACTLDVGLADTVTTEGPSASTFVSGDPDADPTEAQPTSSLPSGTDPGPGTDTQGVQPPAQPTLQLGYSQVKRFDFMWSVTPGAEYYQLWERREPGGAFELIAEDLSGVQYAPSMPLHWRFAASYYLDACNESGCTASSVVDVSSEMMAAIGYFKASNATAGSQFGSAIDLSADGETLAVGANEADSSGSVYVFHRNDQGSWSEQAHIKASSPDVDSLFGAEVHLSADGNTLAVGAWNEDSAATGINGDPNDKTAPGAGAAYVFVRTGESWSQQAYVKASNTDAEDNFGVALALSGDGDTLAVGAWAEGSANGLPSDNSAIYAGAAYVFARVGEEWSQQAYLKASDNAPQIFFGTDLSLSHTGDTLAVSAFDKNLAGAVYMFDREGSTWAEQQILRSANIDAGDYFGRVVELSADGDTLAAGSWYEASASNTINGDGDDDSVPEAGAAYVFTRAGGAWSQQAYIKPPDTAEHDCFGYPGLALSADGQVLAAGAHYEDSAAVGLAGEMFNNAATNAGAAYVFVRDGDMWTFTSYVKAPNTSAFDDFGVSLALSGDGETFAIGAWYEDSASGLGGDQADKNAPDAGAVYVY